jgi:hypothetical protein
MFGNSSDTRDHAAAVATAPEAHFSWDDDDSPKKTIDLAAMQERLKAQGRYKIRLSV